MSASVHGRAFERLSIVGRLLPLLPLVSSLLLAACGGAPMPSPGSASDDEAYVPRSRTAKRRQRVEAKATAKAPDDDADAKPSAPVGAPGSYEEALGHATSGMDDETLPPSECAKPITPTLVMDCGVQGKVSVKLAIQNGHLIGVSADSEPRQPGVEACVLRQARAAAWRKVPGLTTCTRSFKID